MKTIEEEAAACRAAFVGVPVGAPVLHCHHDALVAVLFESAENRINYILHDKPQTEQALRLRLFRPIPPGSLGAEWVKAHAELVKADAEWDKAHAELDKADAEWVKAHAEWDKAHAELDKAQAEWLKAHAEWLKAQAEWLKAQAEWLKTGYHAAICPDCPWDGTTIFAQSPH
jgi:hypothetical protein